MEGLVLPLQENKWVYVKELREEEQKWVWSQFSKLHNDRLTL